jgi:hypothetical protein
MNLTLAKGASLVAADSAQIRKREPDCAFPSSFVNVRSIGSRHAFGKVVVEMNNHHITG